MPTFHDIQQNTPEWEALRVGRVGGSSIGKIMANYGKAFGQPALDLAVRVANEQLTGESAECGYSNAHMERGHEQEPVARAMYEDECFCDVSNGGFFSMGESIGVSPDGLVYEDGLIEIKSVIETVHFSNKKRGSFDPSYKWQLFFNLKVTGREWIDFVSYCSTFPEGKRLYVHRTYSKSLAEQFEMIDSRLEQFWKVVEDSKQIIMR